MFWALPFALSPPIDTPGSGRTIGGMKRRGKWIIALLLAVAFVGVLVAVGASLKLGHAREICVHNLRQIDGAKDQYCLEIGGVVPNWWGTNAQQDARMASVYIPDIENCFCPLATGTNRTFVNSYSCNHLTSCPTCRIRPETHRLDYRPSFWDRLMDWIFD